MILRKIKYGVFIVCIVALVMVLYLSLIGLPDVLARKIEKRLQFSDLVVTLSKVKLGVFEGIIATSVRCHRKGDIGVPLLEAEKTIGDYINIFLKRKEIIATLKLPSFFESK